MATYKLNDLTIVDHEGDRMVDVYRGGLSLGLAFPALDSSGAWDARPAAHPPGREDRRCESKQAAIDYLAA